MPLLVMEGHLSLTFCFVYVSIQGAKTNIIRHRFSLKEFTAQYWKLIRCTANSKSKQHIETTLTQGSTSVQEKETIRKDKALMSSIQLFLKRILFWRCYIELSCLKRDVLVCIQGTEPESLGCRSSPGPAVAFENKDMCAHVLSYF